MFFSYHNIMYSELFARNYNLYAVLFHAASLISCTMMVYIMMFLWEKERENSNLLENNDCMKLFKTINIRSLLIYLVCCKLLASLRKFIEIIQRIEYTYGSIFGKSYLLAIDHIMLALF